jgi:hypothetical protein
MSENAHIDAGAWKDHAKWWAQQGSAARQRLALDEERIIGARAAFGAIGAPIGAAYAEVMAQHEAAGQRLAARAEAIAAQIRSSVASYTDAEQRNSDAMRA